MTKDRFTGSLLGIAVGDALGMPYETMSPEEIAACSVDLSQFQDAGVNPHPFPDAKGQLPGSWTDDTQLTLVMADSLIANSGDLVMADVARRHVEALRHPVGWGGSTRKSCERLALGYSWEHSGEPNGGGNGVMMKIAPVGLREALAFKRPLKEFLRQCIRIGRMTHGVTPAVVAGCVHAVAVMRLVQNQEIDSFAGDDFLEFLKYVAICAEELLPVHPVTISGIISNLESDYFSGVLARQNAAQIGKHFGSGTKVAFTAWNSFGIVYSCFLRYPHSFNGIYETIAAGGDTDSNASMLGALLGALNGKKIVPEHLCAGLRDCSKIEATAADLFSVCSVLT